MRAIAVLMLVGIAAPPSVAIDAVPAGTAAPLREPDVRYEPTPAAKVREMLDLAGLKRGEILYDLGSGDGRIPIAAARDYGAIGRGIDIDPKRTAEATANAVGAGVTGRVRFETADLFTADFSDADVVILFLWPDLNLKLRPRLMALRPGTRIVSYWHDMGDWTPDRTILGGAGDGDLYLWTIPANPLNAGRD